MSLFRRSPEPAPEWWGLERRGGRLFFDGCDLTDVARSHGTPVHVVSRARLEDNAHSVIDAFADFPGGCSVHFSYKTNLVAGVLQVLHEAGVGAEVVCGYELHLARTLGVAGERIVFNGPNKTDDELRAAVRAGVGLIVVDHLQELDRLDRIAREMAAVANVGLRICPDVVPAHMNASSLTGSRKNQFGLDLPAGEPERALGALAASPALRFRGAMAHIGSGIHDLQAFGQAVDVLLDVQARAHELGLEPDLLDVGGGLGTRLSREFTTVEMLAYLGFGRLPALGSPADERLLFRYAEGVKTAVLEGCSRRRIPVPRLILEPGRAMVSDAQVLLLGVGHVRDRPGVGAFALTDGGAMTVSMMFLSEVHGVFLASREGGAPRKVSVFGALPSPMDVVYRNVSLPALEPGDVLAVMDAGAYFTSTSTNFGGPRPGVLLAEGGRVRWIRRPETYEDLLSVEVAAGPKRTDS